MIKVVKFGGSSLANAEQFKKVKDIIKNALSQESPETQLTKYMIRNVYFLIVINIYYYTITYY